MTMCHPVVAMAVAATQAFVQHTEAVQSANAQNKLFKQNQANALSARNIESQGLQQRQSQEAQAASEAMQDRALQARRELATSRVGAGEAGIAGISVDSIMADIMRTASTDIGRIDQNTEWGINQLSSQQLGVNANAQSRIHSVQRQQAPSGWSGLFKVGGAAASSLANAYENGATPTDLAKDTYGFAADSMSNIKTRASAAKTSATNAINKWRGK